MAANTCPKFGQISLGLLIGRIEFQGGLVLFDRQPMLAMLVIKHGQVVMVDRFARWALSSDRSSEVLFGRLEFTFEAVDGGQKESKLGLAWMRLDRSVSNVDGTIILLVVVLNN